MPEAVPRLPGRVERRGRLRRPQIPPRGQGAGQAGEEHPGRLHEGHRAPQRHPRQPHHRDDIQWKMFVLLCGFGFSLPSILIYNRAELVSLNFPHAVHRRVLPRVPVPLQRPQELRPRPRRGELLQKSTLLCAPGLVKIVPAVAILFCLALPGSFLTMFAQNKGDLCT